MKKFEPIASVAIVVSVVVVTLLCSVYYTMVSSEVLNGAKTSMFISDVPTDISDSDLESILKTEFENIHKNAYLICKQVDEKGKEIVSAYVIEGDEAIAKEFYNQNNGKGFGDRQKIIVKNMEDIEYQSLAGSYQSNANIKEIGQVAQNLNARGVSVSTKEFSGIYILAFFFSLGQNNLFLLFFAVIVGLFFAISYSIAKNNKRITVYLAEGFTSFQTFTDGLKRNLVVSSLACLASFVASIAVLLTSGNIYRILDYVKNQLIFFVVLNIIIVIYNLIAYKSISTNVNFVEMEKGRKNKLFLSVSSGISQVILFALLFSVGSTTITNIVQLSKDISNIKQYDSIKGLSYFTLGPEIHKNSVDNDFGSFMRDEDKNGDVLLIVRNSYNLGDLPDNSQSDMPSNSLIVNKRYLEYQTILDVDGNAIDLNSLDDDKIYVAIPPKYTDIQSRIITKVGNYLGPMGQIGQNNNVDPSSIVVLPTKGDQAMANFNSGRDSNNGRFLNPTTTELDPIVLILPASSEVISDGNYINYTTRSSIMFSDENIKQKVMENGLGKYVSSINNTSVSATNAIHDLEKTRALTIIGLLLSFIVLIFTICVRIAIYCDNARRHIFAKYTAGFSFLDTHWSFLLRSFAIVFAPIALIAAFGVVELTTSTIAVGAFIIGSTFLSTYFYLRKYSIKSDYIKR